VTRWIWGGAALIALVAVSLSIGAASLWTSDLGSGWLIAVSRFPRTAAAILAGGGLALAGVVVQQAVQNRFVEPGLSGTPEAAMLGLLVITLWAPGAALWIKMAGAACAAMACTALFLKLAAHVPRSDPMLLPLVGLIYAGILGAVVVWIAWSVDLMQYLGVWQMGEFSGVVQARYELLWGIAALAVLLYALADRITILGLGADAARSLGLDYGQTVALGLAVVAAITALVVVTVGALPFVGLVVPNVVSRLCGDNLRRNLPVVALCGGGAVLAADILARVVRYPYEVPAATIFAIAGAAVFLWLLHAAPKASNG
jgi:iron complex transport system permease protein